MEVVRTKDKNKRYYIYDIPVGSCFESLGDIYIKTNKTGIDGWSYVTALSTGETYPFDPTYTLVPKKVKAVVED